MALSDLDDGTDIEQVKKYIPYYEKLENYEACEGVRQAIAIKEKEELLKIEERL